MSILSIRSYDVVEPPENVSIFFVAVIQQSSRRWNYFLYNTALHGDTLLDMLAQIRPEMPGVAVPRIFSNWHIKIHIYRDYRHQDSDVPDPARLLPVHRNYIIALMRRTPHVEVYMGQFMQYARQAPNGELTCWTALLWLESAANQQQMSMRLCCRIGNRWQEGESTVLVDLEEGIRQTIANRASWGIDVVEMLLKQWEEYMDDEEMAIFRLE